MKSVTENFHYNRVIDRLKGSGYPTKVSVNVSSYSREQKNQVIAALCEEGYKIEEKVQRDKIPRRTGVTSISTKLIIVGDRSEFEGYLRDAMSRRARSKL